MNNKDAATISLNDVLETLGTVFAWGLKPDVERVVLDFASELTGISVDTLYNDCDAMRKEKIQASWDENLLNAALQSGKTFEEIQAFLEGSGKSAPEVEEKNPKEK